MLIAYLEAPFATFRPFTAGWYRPTARFITPSAAYGMLLNIAGIESRIREDNPKHDSKVPTSLMRNDLPKCRIAMGVPQKGWSIVTKSLTLDRTKDQAFPKVQSILQQLHNYPVGSSGGEREKTAFGNKYNITPVRREFLVNLQAVIVLDGNEGFEKLVRSGLERGAKGTRYGIPFLGDNSFLPDRFVQVLQPPPCYWYEKCQSQTESNYITRLTVRIDRVDSSQTVSELYAPTEEASNCIPTHAWIELGDRDGVVA